AGPPSCARADAGAARVGRRGSVRFAGGGADGLRLCVIAWSELCAAFGDSANIEGASRCSRGFAGRGAGSRIDLQSALLRRGDEEGLQTELHLAKGTTMTTYETLLSNKARSLVAIVGAVAVVALSGGASAQSKEACLDAHGRGQDL